MIGSSGDVQVWRRLAGGSAALWLALCSVGAEPPTQQQAAVLETNVTHPARLAYLLYLPASYGNDQQKRWPLILYLHGGSLRGDDVERLRSLGLPRQLETERNFPFLVVSPQCPPGEIWTDADAINALLDRVLRDCRVDPDRVYLTGHSMGGRGALYFAYRLPKRFAAVLALSPYSPVDDWGKRLATLPLWLVHGAADGTAPLADTRALAAAVEAAGGHPRLSVLEGRDHFILDFYQRPEVYAWLLEQRREPSKN